MTWGEPVRRPLIRQDLVESGDVEYSKGPYGSVKLRSLKPHWTKWLSGVPGCMRPTGEKHRATDWVPRTEEDGSAQREWPTCGLCHPPVPSLDVIRRGEPGFSERVRSEG